MVPSMCTQTFCLVEVLSSVQTFILSKAVLFLMEIFLGRFIKKLSNVLFKIKYFYFICVSLPDHKQLTGSGDCKDSGGFDPGASHPEPVSASRPPRRWDSTATVISMETLLLRRQYV